MKPERIDLYTPWREAGADLAARTIGRARLRARIEQCVQDYVNGKRPTPLLFQGSRGAGKSHLLSLALYAFRTAGIHVVYVPEDIPALRSADDLLRRMASKRVQSLDWQTERPGPLAAVVLIEALDRRLAELGTTDHGRGERQRLRAAIQQTGTYVMGTVVSVTDALSAQAEPFYGTFDLEALEPLPASDAGPLLDRQTPEEVRQKEAWPARRSALLDLSGGSPRLILLLGERCTALGDPGSASAALMDVVDSLTPHFQQRFRDVSDHSQHILSALATAPGPLTPTELSARLGSTPQTVAKQCSRLADDGLLVKAPDGSSSPYTLAEPLFRYWLEYRTQSWEESRVSLAAGLLEHLYDEHEITLHWWKSDENELLDRFVRHHPESALDMAIEELRSAINNKDESRIRQTLQKGSRAGLDRQLRAALLFYLRGFVSEEIQSVRRVLGVDSIEGVWVHFAAELIVDGNRPKDCLEKMIARLAPYRTAHDEPWALVAWRTEQALTASKGAGAPWKSLDHYHQAILLDLPHLRALFLGRGRLPGHRPLLHPDALSAAPLRSTDTDHGRLAARAHQLGADNLFERILVFRDQYDSESSLWPCTDWRRPVTRRPESLLSWAIATGTPTHHALTWLPTLNGMEEALFSAHVTRISWDPAPESIPWTVRSPLVALGQGHPSRLRLLYDHAPDAWKELLVPLFTFSQALRAHLLHPELARVAERLGLRPPP